MKNPFHLCKRLIMNPLETSVVVLSDSDNESENIKVVTIDESDVTDTGIEVITLDDSNSNESKPPFVVDKTPDFIPINVKAFYQYKKPKRGRKRRLGTTPDVIVSKKPKRLTEQMITCSEKNITTCNQCKRSNKKSSVTNKSKKFKKRVTKKIKSKLAVNGATKLKTPQIQLTYTNIHNTLVTPRLAGGLRPIIIDGCNVAFGFGNGNFQIEGIILVIEYFKKRGHKEIVSFLPQNYKNKTRPQDVSKQIQGYEKENIITYTPSRRLNGKLIMPYDDRFIVQYASEREGVIVSNDGYLDLINEEPSWRTTIEQRIINFTFARGLLMLPKDPLGPNGPTLDEMLKFPST